MTAALDVCPICDSDRVAPAYKGWDPGEPITLACAVCRHTWKRGEVPAATTVINIKDLPKDERGRPILGPDDVYIGRPSQRLGLKGSPYHNPFSVKKYGRAECLRLFRIHVLAQPLLIERAKRDLKGKRLVCYCLPEACHGQIWAAIVDHKPPILYGSIWEESS